MGSTCCKYIMDFSTDGCYDNPTQILGGDGHPGVYDNSEGLGMKIYCREVFQEGTGAVGENIGILSHDDSTNSKSKLI